LLATKTERDAKLAFLWYAFLHYVLRPWPWIVIGLLSLIYFPGLEDKEHAFPEMIDYFLPIGLKGVMVAAMLAAFMSTIDTHLNWGASYLVNDVYQPYIKKNASPKHYVWVARITMVVIMGCAIYATTKIPDIVSAFKFTGVFFAGIGTVMIARWFWWRVNAATELFALWATIIFATIALIFIPDIEIAGDKIDRFGVRILFTTFGVAMMWIPFAITSSKEPSESAIAFHKKMQIGGKGWNKISKVPAELTAGIYEWILVMALLLCILLGTGKLLFHEWIMGGVLIGAAAILFLPFLKVLSRARAS
jgi:SSS family solute:Na+ symporter